MMKVKELKELLGKADDNADVWIADGAQSLTENFHEIYDVKEVKSLSNNETSIYISILMMFL